MYIGIVVWKVVMPCVSHFLFLLGSILLITNVLLVVFMVSEVSVIGTDSLQSGGQAEGD
jgi:hypothetical protein